MSNAVYEEERKEKRGQKVRFCFKGSFLSSIQSSLYTWDVLQNYGFAYYGRL